jgi:excisionase family DNA binding protein
MDGLEMLSAPEVATLLGVDPSKIHAWIKAGELRGSNLAARRTGRPRWKVSREAIAEFLAAREERPRPKPVRKRKEERDVISFY